MIKRQQSTLFEFVLARTRLFCQEDLAIDLRLMTGEPTFIRVEWNKNLFPVLKNRHKKGVRITDTWVDRRPSWERPERGRIGGRDKEPQCKKQKIIHLIVVFLLF